MCIICTDERLDLVLVRDMILLWCQSNDILLLARHIPGKLNILADALSRSHMVLQTEWTLCPEVSPKADLICMDL